MGKYTTLTIKRLVEPGRYADGDGLYLQVRDAERRSWLFRFMLAGKAREMGLGAYPTVGLADARELAAEARKLLRAGTDPLGARRAASEARKAEETIPLTFHQVADRYIAAHESGWKSATHRAQWRSTLDAYVHPVFGDLPIATIATGHVMEALESIWKSKTETASRLRGRIEAVLDYATARGWRTGENPARWRGHVANLLPRRSKLRAVVHHAALPWGEVGGFLAQLREQDGIAARCLELTILTATRTGEAIGARWAEIDLVGGVWTIPAGRMKAGKEHRVPLSGRALELLRELREARGEEEGDEHVFSFRSSRSLSNMAMAALLRRMGRSDLTVHGFRSTFRDWVAESTAYPREVAEAALAHTVRDKVEAAYQRGDLFTKRARLMEEWATFCSQPARREGVVALRA